MKILSCIAISLMYFAIGYLIGSKPSFNANNSQYIHIDSVKMRIYEQFGEGDEGEEEINYILTGKHLDMFGNTIEIDSQYVKNGIVMYREGKFVDFIEY